MSFNFEKINPTSNYVILSGGSAEEFRHWVSDNTGILTNITTLVVTNSGLTEREAQIIATKFPNLESLVLSNNQIEKFELSSEHLPKLVNLVLTNAGLSTLPNCLNREGLSVNCSANSKISTATTMVNLKELQIDTGSSIQGLDLTGTVGLLNINKPLPQVKSEFPSLVKDLHWDELLVGGSGVAFGTVVVQDGANYVPESPLVDVTQWLEQWRADNSQLIPETAKIYSLDSNPNHYKDGCYIIPSVVAPTSNDISSIAAEIIAAEGRVHLELLHSDLLDADLENLAEILGNENLPKIYYVGLSKENIVPNLTGWSCTTVVGMNLPKLKHVVLPETCTIFSAPWSTISSLEQSAGSYPLWINIEGTQVQQLNAGVNRDTVTVQDNYTVLDPAFSSKQALVISRDQPASKSATCNTNPIYSSCNIL